MAEEIQASQILLEVSEQLKNMQLLLQNMDFKYSLILNRLNEMQKINLSSPLSSIKEEPLHFVSVDLPKTEEIKPTVPQKERIVRQKVIYPAPLLSPGILATVRLYSGDIRKIEKDKVLLANNIKTDMKGYWNHKMAPGTYFVHIVKKAQANKPQIDYYNQIIIPEGNDVFELPPVSANG